MALLKKSGRIRSTVIGGIPCTKSPVIRLHDKYDGEADKEKYEQTFELFDKVQNEVADLEGKIKSAVQEVISLQSNANVDVVTDGEVSRDNYIHYHCRHVNNVDFSNLNWATGRAGKDVYRVPTVVGPVSSKNDGFLVHDWKRAQSLSQKPVKMTIPGPMTIADTLADRFYYDRRRLCIDLAKAINVEVLDLARAGCQHIQLDEAAFSRYPKDVAAWGIECLNLAIENLPSTVHTQVHCCYGYPDEIYEDELDPNEPTFKMADPRGYFDIAPHLNNSKIDAIALEDAHWNHSLDLYKLYTKKQLCLGVVAIARAKIETVDEIKKRIKEVLSVFPPDRLLVAPDCGMTLLTPNQASQKLSNMSQAIAQLNEELGLADRISPKL